MGEIYTIEFINEYENHISLKEITLSHGEKYRYPIKQFNLRLDLMRDDKLNQLLK